MNILKMVQFEDSDWMDLRRITGWCNEAFSFISDRGLKAVTKLSSGNLLQLDDLEEARREIERGRVQVVNRVPDTFFPEELKVRYEKNLCEARDILTTWIKEFLAY
jgi:acyl-CoA synthetase (AMP-forming)/AMP-acid ligase II